MKHIVSLTLVFLIGSIPCVHAQITAQAVLQNMVDAYEQRTATISDYTVVSDAFTSYHKKYTDNGRTLFKSTTQLNTMGNPMVGTMTTQMGTDNPYRMQALLAEHVTYAGTHVIDGKTAHVLELTDFTAFADTEQPNQGTPKYVRYAIDADDWVLLEIEMQMETLVDGTHQTVNPHIRFEDYRTVDGLLYPFRTIVEMRGMAVDTSISSEQIAEARAAIASIDERLKDLPETQRKQMKAMMKPQVERFEQMIANSSEGLTMTYTVTDIQVNTGLSDDLFETKL